MSAATPTPRRRPVTLHDLVLLAVLAVVFGFLYWALVQVWGWLQVAMGPMGDLAQNVLIGGWMVVAPLALYIVRKPGVGIVVEIIASIVEVVFLASPVGPTLILVALIQGVGAEAAFAATRYRRYGWWVFVVSGITAALANLVLGMVRFGWAGQDLFALRVGFQFASGILLCGLLAKVIGDALLRTGVLDNYAIGRAAREAERATGRATEPAPTAAPEQSTQPEVSARTRPDESSGADNP
ncbi:ECF transporter S component [Ruania alba]|uniref:Energy-coupling factor transport system substrate-specific component n=1 Tax=Ruania alba TaxID=648782 RepID=A0A1H5MWV6_9MICO|nr:ECF transporter S component [Ruania alba]SEE93849.1 energy-coupling factor transport system substrate-specific component [Ruania alba]